MSQQPPARSWPYLAPISKMRCPGGGLSHSPIRCGSPRSRRAGLRLTLHIALYLAKFSVQAVTMAGAMAGLVFDRVAEALTAP